MSEDSVGKNWKLDLRYGRIKTPYMHYTVIADGLVGELEHGFSGQSGPAFMGMKTWSSSPVESMEMARAIGEQIGFRVTGRTYVYDTEPTEPPGDEPHGYEIRFTSYGTDQAT